MSHFFHTAQFLLGAAQLHQLPADQGREVAFAGRSNAGKSSVLNTLCGQKALARVSRTPGRTQEINIFGLQNAQEHRLIDLPGYGYAKVPLAQRQRWEQLLGDYLRQRQSLTGVVIILDSRRGITELDAQLLSGLARREEHATALPLLHFVLTKADKLSRNAAQQALHQVVHELEDTGWEATVQLFSSLDRTGLDDLRELLLTWFQGVVA